jgi:benzoate membrane transport protein
MKPPLGEGQRGAAGAHPFGESSQPPRSLLRDFSVPALVAGFVTVLVGFTSSAVLVFEAARALGADDAQIASWMWALGIGMSLTCALPSLRWRMPVVTAWSTPGAAMLITAGAGVRLEEAVAGFMVSALLIVASGFSGWFERMMNRIPIALASAMLAGVLLRFGIEAFSSMQARFELVFPMFAAWLLVRRLLPRYAVMAALVVGVAIAGFGGELRTEGLGLSLAMPVWTTPSLSLAAVVGIALPLYVVTMASQNLPGVAVIRASGYPVPISPMIGWTGVATLVLAPFGGFAINLAAITAAICMGPEAHEDRSRRYVASVAAGGFYLVIGLFGATVAAVFAAFPRELIMAIAGLALIGTIGNGLAAAVAGERDREAAVVTFLVTASGLSLAGIGAAFWGLVAGVLTLLVLNLRRRGA